MKNIILLTFLFLSFWSNLNSQERKSANFNIHTSISNGELILFGDPLIGGVSYNGQAGYLIGIGSSLKINDRLALQFGIDFSRNSFSSSSVILIGSSIESIDSENIDLFTVPLNIKLKLKNQFYLIGGILIDKVVNRISSNTLDNQSGVGMNFKIGRNFKFANGTFLSISPEILTHSIIPFSPDQNHHRLIEAGIRLGYTFKM